VGEATADQMVKKKSIKKHRKMKSATRRLTLHLLVIESVALTCRKYVNYLEME
jgi:preprotein translocase subunit SecY